MKTPSHSTNVVTGIFATFFSIFFVISLLLTAIMWGVSSLVTPKGLTDFITSDNVIDFVRENADIDDMLEQSDIPQEAIADLLESDFADELLSAYADGMSVEILGTESSVTYDEEYFKELCIEKKSDIMSFLEKFPEAEGLNDEEMDEVFNNFIEDVPAQLASGISEASVALSESTDDIDYAEVYQFIAKQLPIILTVHSLVLLMVCWLLRIKFTYGLLWPGVTSVVGGTITALLTMLLGSSTNTLAEISETPYIIPVFNTLSERMLIVSIIPLVLGIALIVAKVLISNKILNNEEPNESCIRN